ncbi:MAG: DUF167 domain-containing protein, partial [Candidatus Ranarchaeia archaeon]
KADKNGLEFWLPFPPLKGKANRLLLKQISRLLSVKGSDMVIVKGLKSRRKVVEIKGISQEELSLRLRSLSVLNKRG